MSNIQIICFTYAGGNKHFYDVFDDDLSEFELVKMEYAGHGDRYKEEYYQSIDELADDMFQRLCDIIKGDYALFGYSMGSVALVEVLKRIIISGIEPPIHVFLAAHEPFTQTELLKLAGDELDRWVKNRTIEYGGVPDKLMNNEVFWRTYLPMFRADYTIIGKYRFEELDMRTKTPATVFYSEEDTPLDDMKHWEEYFIDECSFCEYDGTHFFIQGHHEEMADVIKDRINRSKR